MLLPVDVVVARVPALQHDVHAPRGDHVPLGNGAEGGAAVHAVHDVGGGGGGGAGELRGGSRVGAWDHGDQAVPGGHVVLSRGGGRLDLKGKSRKLLGTVNKSMKH